MRNLVLAILLIGIFSGCGSDGGSGEAENTNGTAKNLVSDIQEDNEIIEIEKTTKNFKYWGEWETFDNSEDLYISTKDNFIITDLGENLIQIDKKTYQRKGFRNVKVEGKLSKREIRSLKGYETIGGIELILKNVTDGNIKTEMEVKNDGTFEDDSLPTGEYKLSLESTNISLNVLVRLIAEYEELNLNLDPNQENLSIEDIGDLIKGINQQKPIAELEISGETRPLTFDFSKSSDDKEIISYILDSSVDGRLYLGTDKSFTTSDLTLGIHTFTLTVYDNDGLFSVKTDIFEVPEVIENINLCPNGSYQIPLTGECIIDIIVCQNGETLNKETNECEKDKSINNLYDSAIFDNSIWE